MGAGQVKITTRGPCCSQLHQWELCPISCSRSRHARTYFFPSKKFSAILAALQQSEKSAMYELLPLLHISTFWSIPSQWNPGSGLGLFPASPGFLSTAGADGRSSNIFHPWFSCSYSKKKSLARCSTNGLSAQTVSHQLKRKCCGEDMESAEEEKHFTLTLS